MDRGLTALPARPRLSWPWRLVLVLSMPLWLPIVGIVLAYAILVAPDPVETEPAMHDDEDGLPDDDVPPFVPPPRRTSGRPPLAIRRPTLALPAPVSITDASSPGLPPTEQLAPLATCWPTSFPAG